MGKDIRKFKGFKAEINIDKLLRKAGRESVKELKEKSPNGDRTKNKYKDTWSYQLYNKGTKHSYAEVRNKKNYRLTHLLENGHLIVNKVGAVGWSAPRKHIKPVAKHQSEELVKELKEKRYDTNNEFYKFGIR